MAPTPKRGLPQPAGTDLISGGDDAIKAGFLALDDAMFWSSGTLAARPAASTAKAATAYLSTDTTPPRIDISDGTNWRRVYPLDDLEVTLAKLATAVQQGIATAGDIKATGRSTAPAGWLMCDGTSYLRTDYPDLFAALGGTSSPYGLPDGTHFQVPDLRGRVPVGADGTAGRLTASDALGNAAGEEKHTITVSEMPAHNHGGATGTESADHTHSGTTVANGAHSHTVAPGYNLYYAASVGGSLGINISNPNYYLRYTTVASDTEAAHAHSFTTGGRSAVHTHAITTQGTGLAANNMQPYQVVNYLVKT